jgi:predicted RNA-binding protein with PIN domain
MHYFIDGYNLLFRLSTETKTLEEARKQIIDSLVDTKFSLTLVFDGKRDDLPHRMHKGSLEIIYTSQGQSADAYILEAISLVKNPKVHTVITSDKNLASFCCKIGAYAQPIDAFLTLLKKSRAVTTHEKPVKDTNRELSRLLKIFMELDKKQ